MPFIDDLASAGGLALADRAIFYSIIQEMIDRKQAYFARITRYIISFDVQTTGDRKYFISVVSTLPLPAAGKY